MTSDHLGSTRVVTKQDGTVKARYDYVPFGEEIGSGIGGRATAMGYSPSITQDNTRQKFTQKERDNESGLDYFLARYYSSTQGRFTSADLVIGHIANPQTLNRYLYARNNPLRFIDPYGNDGLDALVNTLGELALGIAKGYGASISLGLAPNSAPSESDSDLSLFGQWIGSALALQEGADLDAAGGVIEFGSLGFGTEIAIPAEVVGTALMASAAKNSIAVLEMSVIRKLSDADVGPGEAGPTPGRNNEEAGGARPPKRAGQDVEVKPGPPSEEPQATGRTGGRGQPKDMTPEGTVDQLQGLQKEQKARTKAGGYRISTRKSEQNIDTINKKTL